MKKSMINIIYEDIYQSRDYYEEQEKIITAEREKIYDILINPIYKTDEKKAARQKIYFIHMRQKKKNSP